MEIIKLNNQIKCLEGRINDCDFISQTSPPPPLLRETPCTENESPASSPISYLWSQSTIQCPARDYQNPKWNNTTTSKDVDPHSWGLKVIDAIVDDNINGSITRTVSPIQKPRNNELDRNDNSDVLSITSDRSIGSHSIASTYNVYDRISLIS